MPPPAQELTADNVGGVPVAEFDAYAARLYQYLQVVEQRLFSEGLHTFGQAPTPAQVPLFLVSGGGGYHGPLPGSCVSFQLYSQ